MSIAYMSDNKLLLFFLLFSLAETCTTTAYSLHIKTAFSSSTSAVLQRCTAAQSTLLPCVLFYTPDSKTPVAHLHRHHQHKDSKSNPITPYPKTRNP